jgi:dihydropteroate synthase
MKTNQAEMLLTCPNGVLNLSSAQVMGILNVTPDSFYDGGRYTHEEAILIHAEQMLEEGASIIDIGAVSTRPGAKVIPEKEELARLLPAIKAVRKYFPAALISADTYRAVVARAAVEAGADIINDIAGGNGDAGMFGTVGKLQVPYILMHIQGTPETMQENPQYTDVCLEVGHYFREKLAEMASSGIQQILLDPGFGFGKSLEHNYELLNGLDSLCLLGHPVLAGLSRKSMINKTLSCTPEEALYGTTAANTIALLKGASILRVHDVKQAVDAIKIVGRLKTV